MKNSRSFATFVAAAAVSILLAANGSDVVAQTASPFTLEIMPAAPRLYETVRVRISNASSQGVNSITMVANRITLTLGSTSTTLPPFTPATMDVVIGQLPEGSYELEVRRQPDFGQPFTVLGTKQIAVAGIAMSARGPGVPTGPWSGIWWNPTEPGWGISILIKDRQVIRPDFFAAWYVYDASGKATWYTLQDGDWSTSLCYRGRVLKTSGSPWGGITALSGITIADAGIGTLCFVNYDSATFTYTVEGQSSSKNLMRF